ncbi:hypothetical protein HanIR_Chr13g0632141 [Helianthus annuus]|nr:hypothetical protein HanIR_Chr13g0632141 [Helianthus annuus]
MSRHPIKNLTLRNRHELLGIIICKGHLKNTKDMYLSKRYVSCIFYKNNHKTFM